MAMSVPRKESLSIACPLYWEGGTRAAELGCNLKLGQPRGIYASIQPISVPVMKRPMLDAV